MNTIIINGIVMPCRDDDSVDFPDDNTVSDDIKDILANVKVRDVPY